ncbi:hypothetical protein RJ640_002838 [Escallonia rubra]|uniref:3-hydroxyisobutyryl-CoA hydrolase n=1 Tax=Escallonia rubra TaxID=112253 RepID=A0AA88QUW6_9ASTE|nr:hypothetical protein RJ640_002838 [Escallonia rubra]
MAVIMVGVGLYGKLTCEPSKVALLNRVTMGGGAGVSIPGTFRVATDKTESEATKTDNAWCISTLKRLKDAVSPLSLKVSLRSVINVYWIQNRGRGELATTVVEGGVCLWWVEMATALDEDLAKVTR